MTAYQLEADKLELAARRFLAERGEAPVVPRDAITRAMDQGMTWPIGCLGMPAGYVVDSSSAATAATGSRSKVFTPHPGGQGGLDNRCNWCRSMYRRLRRGMSV